MTPSGRALSRRQVLRLASVVAVGAGAAGILAACGGAPASPAAKAEPTKPAAAEPAKPAAAEPTKPAAAPAGAPTPTAQPAAAKPGASAPAAIRFTTWWAPMEQYLDEVKKQFESANPGVTVTPEFITSEFVQKMEASLVANTWGDASIIDNGVQVKFMDAGLHLDMSDMVKADGINLQADYSLMGLEIWEGKVLCMPFDNDPRGIYYNKTVFKEVGAKDPWDDLKGNWTWDDMIDAARKSTKKEGDKITRYGLLWNYTSYQEFSPLVWTLGGNYANWKTLKYTLDDPKVLEVHKMLYQWANEEKFLMTKEAVTNMLGPGGPNAFRAGVAVMYHRAAYEVNLMREAIGTKFEWDVAPFPNKDANTLGAPVTSGNPNFVPKGTKYPEQAYKWLRTLSSDEVQSLFAKNKVFVPSNKKAWKTYQTTEPPKHAESFIKWIYGRPHGFHFYNAGMSKAGETINAELDLAYLGKQTIERALQNAHTKANEVVNFGKAKDPFAFTVPKPPEKDLTKWGVA